MNGDAEEPGAVAETIEFWLPVITPQDHAAVKRILDWKLDENKKLYTFLHPVKWEESPRQDEYPATMGWKVYAEEKR